MSRGSKEWWRVRCYTTVLEELSLLLTVRTASSKQPASYASPRELYISSIIVFEVEDIFRRVCKEEEEEDEDIAQELFLDSDSED
jgi:hypothetical protein